ncbi:hypothetical protein BHE74_00031901 [Ensete ventricosum]|nr:hypothetical protein BHE74_00031901 [Ensete ventricosum]
MKKRRDGRPHGKPMPWDEAKIFRLSASPPPTVPGGGDRAARNFSEKHRTGGSEEIRARVLDDIYRFSATRSPNFLDSFMQCSVC